MVGSTERRDGVVMKSISVIAFGFIVLFASSPVASPDQPVLGYPSVTPSFFVESSDMVCDKKTLRFERVSRFSEDGVVRREASLKLAGVPLEGEAIDLLKRSLDKRLGLVAMTGSCSKGGRALAEFFHISVMYQWDEPDPSGQGRRLMCGMVNLRVDSKHPVDVRGGGSEWESGSLVGLREMTPAPANVLCI